MTTDIANNMTLIDDAFASTAPGNSAVADTASAGSTLVAARADHRHGRENFGTPVGIGAANANGSATTVARSDHVHAHAAASLGSPGNSAVGDSASDGVATTAARSDHQHGREAFGSVSNLTGSAANGSATTLARSDHAHSIAVASQAAGDILYATSGTAFTRLGITAGGYIKGNAGGTAPEYSPAGQIVFPATQNASADANTLDDYEEGTWTPAVGGTATYTTQEGRYTKVGRLVVIHCRLIINVIGTGSTATLTGNPFSANSTPSYQAGSVCYFNSLAINTIFLTVYATGSNIFFTDQGASDGGVNDQSALFGNSAQVMFSIPYYV